jgi:hypothetical protein
MAQKYMPSPARIKANSYPTYHNDFDDQLTMHFHVVIGWYILLKLGRMIFIPS